MIDLGDELADYDGATPKRTYHPSGPIGSREPTCLGTLKDLQASGFNVDEPCLSAAQVRAMGKPLVDQLRKYNAAATLTPKMTAGFHPGGYISA